MQTNRPIVLRQLSALLASVACAAAFSTPAQAQVGVNVQVGQPGFYGQIQVGNTQPQVIYQQPMIIQRPVVATPMQPIYLRVPPGHAKKWAKHCSRYNACGRPVYFVRDDWYQRVYAPSVVGVPQPGPRGEHHGRGYPGAGDHDGDRPGHGHGHGRGRGG